MQGRPTPWTKTLLLWVAYLVAHTVIFTSQALQHRACLCHSSLVRTGMVGCTIKSGGLIGYLICAKSHDLNEGSVSKILCADDINVFSSSFCCTLIFFC